MHINLRVIIADSFRQMVFFTLFLIRLQIIYAACSHFSVIFLNKRIQAHPVQTRFRWKYYHLGDDLLYLHLAPKNRL